MEEEEVIAAPVLGGGFGWKSYYSDCDFRVPLSSFGRSFPFISVVPFFFSACKFKIIIVPRALPPSPKSKPPVLQWAVHLAAGWHAWHSYRVVAKYFAASGNDKVQSYHLLAVKTSAQFFPLLACVFKQRPLPPPCSVQRGQCGLGEGGLCSQDQLAPQPWKFCFLFSFGFCSLSCLLVINIIPEEKTFLTAFLLCCVILWDCPVFPGSDALQKLSHGSDEYKTELTISHLRPWILVSKFRAWKFVLWPACGLRYIWGCYYGSCSQFGSPSGTKACFKWWWNTLVKSFLQITLSRFEFFRDCIRLLHQDPWQWRLWPRDDCFLVDPDDKLVKSQVNCISEKPLASSDVCASVSDRVAEMLSSEQPPWPRMSALLQVLAWRKKKSWLMFNFLFFLS